MRATRLQHALELRQIIATMTFLDGLPLTNRRALFGKQLPCGSINYNPQPTMVFLIEVSDAVDPSNGRCDRFCLKRNPGECGNLIKQQHLDSIHFQYLTAGTGHQHDAYSWWRF